MTISFEDVAGKCAVIYAENVEDLTAWTKGGPNRFYFRKAYNAKTNTFMEPSKEAKQLGSTAKVVSFLFYFFLFQKKIAIMQISFFIFPRNYNGKVDFKNWYRLL